MDKDSNIRTYPDMGELAFGKTGRLIISGLIYTELFLVSVGFLILEGDNLSNLFPTVEIHTAGLAIGGKKLFVILVALVLDNLRILSYVSASRVFASAIIILSISWTATFDGVGFHQKGTLVNWKGNPTAVSLYAFCYCAHPVFPSLYNSMRNKHQFSNGIISLSNEKTHVLMHQTEKQVLLVSFLLSTAGYASMAIICCLMFGPKVESQVTLNLKINKTCFQGLTGIERPES
ncbi:Vacuolar amino acid transporter 1 [Glycine soja]|nr:Vacuolar amino acid transporter 1 [Glycine soja]